ncbi:glycosyltransferase family 61 protein [Lysinibacillus telephonicus]|uniref:Glycosyltransferase family 61 protein n=1 Tax=Lysinibacillus telephonicus TaxID=1714840 RepID=A0A3S0JSZ4_9BACI|nr:glycosyltransferase family 61 protein [Lysinibacillus telephonicus]RTQ94287.1 glycosyltransferase family 61 protein [Lysinibacillus telephonicus]
MQKFSSFLNGKNIILVGYGLEFENAKNFLEAKNMVIDIRKVDFNLEDKNLIYSKLSELSECFLIIASYYKRKAKQFLNKLSYVINIDYIYFEQIFSNSNDIYILNNLIRMNLEIENKSELLNIFKKDIGIFQKENLIVGKNENYIYPQNECYTGNLYYFIADNSYAFGLNSHILDENGRVVQEFSYKGEVNPNSRFWDNRSPFNLEMNYIFEPYYHYLNKEVAVTATRYAKHNYFHWMFEELPRFMLLKYLDIVPDFYLSSFSGEEYQVETLKLIGVDLEKILPSSASSEIFYLKAKKLIVPYNPANDFGYIPSWIVNFLENLFSKELLQDFNSPRKIYISREDAKVRRIVNEDECIGNLIKLGYKKVTLSNYTVLEKAKLFYNATHIISPYGAALANLVFCRNNTRIIEIVNSKRITSVYLSLSKKKNLKHEIFESREIEELEKNSNNSDIYLDIELFKEFLSNRNDCF